MLQINNLNRSFWNREFIALDQRQDGTLDLHIRTLNIFQQALRWLFGSYSNTIWNQQKATVLVNGLANEKEWKHVEKAITDPDLFEKVFKVAKKVIIPKDENTQNVLIVGRSRSGKSTMINMLKDLGVCQVANVGTIFAQTRNPTKVKTNLGDYEFKFLDTPGLTEYAPKGQVARSNDEIIELIRKEVRNIFGGRNFEHVDTVIFTMTVGKGINSDEIACMETFLPMLPEDVKKLIVVTNQEGDPGEYRESIIRQFQQHSEMGPLLKDHFDNGDNVLLSGCLDQNDVVVEESAFKRKLNTIYRQSRDLIHAILPETLSNEKKAEFLKKRATSLYPHMKAFLKAGSAKDVVEVEDEELENFVEKK